MEAYMIDIHSHILFEIDDGAVTINDSIALIREEIRQGVNSIICTPHYKNDGFDAEKVSHNFKMLKEKLEAESLTAQLYLGSEVYFNSGFYDMLEKDVFLPLADTRYLLIEFNYINTPVNAAEMCYEMKIRGYVPIIAHTERYNGFYEDRHLLDDILNEGALLQVNASSIVEKDVNDFDNNHKFAYYLLKNELISFVASDAHNMESRGIKMEEAYRKVLKLNGKSYADKIFSFNQQKLLSNEMIETEFKKKVESKGKNKGLLSKIFKN
jgi:protein-tyrosine phosphatase